MAWPDPDLSMVTLGAWSSSVVYDSQSAQLLAWHVDDTYQPNSARDKAVILTFVNPGIWWCAVHQTTHTHQAGDRFFWAIEEEPIGQHQISLPDAQTWSRYGGSSGVRTTPTQYGPVEVIGNFYAEAATCVNLHALPGPDDPYWNQHQWINVYAIHRLYATGATVPGFAPFLPIILVLAPLLFGSGLLPITMLQGINLIRSGGIGSGTFERSST